MDYFLGIDSGLRKTGWGIISRQRDRLLYVASGLIQTKISPMKEDEYKSDAAALLEIYKGISDVIKQYSPGYAAIENTYVNKNPISSLKLAQARAAALVACAENNLIPKEYQASAIKKVVCGKGNIDKEQVNKMVMLQLGKITTKSHDESDAIAIAMCDALSYHGR